MSETRVDWTYIRFQYEVLGISIEEIARENSFLSAGLIEEAAKTGGWVYGNLDSLVPVVQEAAGEEGGLEAFTAATKAHLVGASLVKQRALFPTFAKCEAALLSKLTQAVLLVNPEDDKAATRLANLVKSFQGLISHNSFLTMQAAAAGADDDGSKFTIQIIQQVN